MRMLPLLLVPMLLPAGATASDAPTFLSGRVSQDKTVPATWSEKTDVLWKADVPGSGWSSPVVVGDKVFVTFGTDDKDLPEPRKGLYVQDLQGKPVKGKKTWQVRCLDAKTGKELWTTPAFEGTLGSTLHIKNSLASETPVADDKHVYAVFGSVGIVCLDHAGKVVWKKPLDPVKTQMGWGGGSSPALADGKLVWVNDNEEASYIEALDAKTGKPAWKTPREEKSNWGTPFVWKTAGRTEIVTAGKGAVRSYSTDGKVLWSLKGMSVISIPSPFEAEGMLYVSSGYVMDVTKPVYAIKPGATGDITLNLKEASNKYVAWSQPMAGAYHPTPVVADGLLYVLLDRGYLSCYDAKTGKEVYRNKKLGPTQFTASPWVANGKVFCLAETGETVVVKAGKTFEVVGTNKLPGMAMATPVMAGGSLFVRTREGLWCLRAK